MKKTALITGGSGGIGASCARTLAADGHDIVLNFLNSEQRARHLAEELGGTCFKADVSDREQMHQMFTKHDAVDILVCSAGVSLIKLFTDTAEAEWRELLDVNLGGVINCCQAAIPHMVRNKYGRIVVISSVWGVTGASCEAVYAASKSALIGLTKSLAKELGPSGITVNCVTPGVIDTGMNSALTPETKEELIGATPLGRFGQAHDVAALVSFLSSDAAGFITGQVIGVDGGFTG